MKTKNLIQDKENIIKLLSLKNYDVSATINEIEKLYPELLDTKKKLDSLREETNSVSKIISTTKDKAERARLIKGIKDNKDIISNLTLKNRDLNEEIDNLKASLPNIPSKKVPVGKDEKSNKVIFESKIIKSNIKSKPHWDLLEKVVDENASALISGSRFVVYKDLGAVMVESLKSMMIDYHRSNGYKLYSAPVIVNSNVLYGTGQLPKFKDDLYQVDDDKYLIPTAEATLTNIFREKIFEPNELPKKIVAYSNCFRKEAGASGKDTRGIKRLHQFNKVELVHILEKKDDEKLLNEMLDSAIEIVKMLELPYRVLSLSTGELTFSSSITYDIEVWMPGQNEWMEVSSISSCSDFQGERINTRTRDEDGKSFVYTQNGSGIAIDRAIAAILENHQNENGEINIPLSLQKYMGVDKIS